jgi:hypothetical protein
MDTMPAMQVEVCPLAEPFFQRPRCGGENRISEKLRLRQPGFQSIGKGLEFVDTWGFKEAIRTPDASQRVGSRAFGGRAIDSRALRIPTPAAGGKYSVRTVQDVPHSVYSESREPRHLELEDAAATTGEEELVTTRGMEGLWFKQPPLIATFPRRPKRRLDLVQVDLQLRIESRLTWGWIPTLAEGMNRRWHSQLVGNIRPLGCVLRTLVFDA